MAQKKMEESDAKSKPKVEPKDDNERKEVKQAFGGKEKIPRTPP